MKEFASLFFRTIREYREHEEQLRNRVLVHNIHAFVLLAVLFTFSCGLFAFQTLFFPNKLAHEWLQTALFLTFAAGMVLSAIFLFLVFFLHVLKRAAATRILVYVYAFATVTVGSLVSVWDCVTGLDMSALFVVSFAVCLFLSAPYRAYILIQLWVFVLFISAYMLFLKSPENQGLPFTLFFLVMTGLVGGSYVQYSRVHMYVLSVRLEEANRCLRESAVRDALTGAYNRLFFEEYIEKQERLMKRYNEDMSLILLDIDHFKLVNDTFGHQTGDQVLKTLVDTLSENIRDSDIVARYGGEEFIIMLPKTGPDAAFFLADKLRMVVATTTFESVPWPVTFSAGVGTLQSDEMPHTFLARIDEALYRAKRKGRNCVEQARNGAPATGVLPPPR